MLGAVRAVVALLAIPLAPVLYEDHFMLLVLMRPTKEVLLAGGFALRLGEVGLVPLVAAAVPLSIFAVWLSYFIGLAYAREIESGKLPRWVRRVVSPKRIRTMRELLDKKGPRIVFLGRLAAFPSAALAVAAGSGRMPPREFLPVDGLGGLVSIAEVVGAGFALGYTYKRAGPWITAVGVAVLVAVAVIVARFLRRT